MLAEYPEVVLINGFVSAVERRRREHAVAFALASVGLEGMTPSAATMALARRFVNGEINLVEFVSVGLRGDVAAGTTKVQRCSSVTDAYS